MENPQIRLLIAEDEPAQQELLLLYLQDFDYVRVVDIVKTGDELIQRVTTDSNVNALLLDLKLGEGRSGLDSYSTLRFRGKNIPAILVTGAIPEASYTYDLGIIDIVEKPFTAFRFKQSIEKLCNHMKYQAFVEHGGVYIPIYNQDIQLLTPADILFIESVNRTIQVHTTIGIMETKIPLKVYEQYLQEYYFYPTHRSYLVNLKKIRIIANSTIYFHDDRRTAFIAEDKAQEFAFYWEAMMK